MTPMPALQACTPRQKHHHPANLVGLVYADLFSPAVLIKKQTMKFRVCGGLDAPDWVLAQTSRVGALAVAPGTLTKLAICAARNLEAAGATAAGQASTIDTPGETAALQDALAFSSRTELEAALGVVEFLVTNSVKYEVRGSRLINELTQLGLSKAGADELEAVVDEHWDRLCSAARQSILRLGRPHPETSANVIVPDEANVVDTAETTIDNDDKTSDQDQKLPATTNGLVSINMVNEVPIMFSSDPAKLALLVEELSRAVDIATQARASLS